VLVVAPSRKRAFSEPAMADLVGEDGERAVFSQEALVDVVGVLPIVSMVMKLSRRPRLPYSAVRSSWLAPIPASVLWTVCSNEKVPAGTSRREV
jgi:hypothetical protein